MTDNSMIVNTPSERNMEESQEIKKKLSPAELLAIYRYDGKVTRRLREKVLAMVRGGTPPRIALRGQGVARSTIDSWRALANDDQCMDKRAVLWRELEQAENQCIDNVAHNAARLTAKDGRVAVDWLSRRAPEEFGKKDEVAVTYDIGPVLTDIAGRIARGELINGSYKVLPPGE